MSENSRECAQHEEAIENLKQWQAKHEGVTHVEINADLKEIRNRLPNWATLVIGFLSSAVGYLLALVKVTAGG